MFDMAEVRRDTANALSKEASERLKKRESQLHTDIRVRLQILKLGEGECEGFLDTVKVAGSRDDFTRAFGEKSFASFMKAMKRARSGNNGSNPGRNRYRNGGRYRSRGNRRRGRRYNRGDYDRDRYGNRDYDRYRRSEDRDRDRTRDRNRDRDRDRARDRDGGRRGSGSGNGKSNHDAAGPKRPADRDNSRN